MKLYEVFAHEGYHSCVISTFGLDFATLEDFVLRKLHGAGCTNVFVVADAAMLTQSLDGASVAPRFAGRLYTVNAAAVSGLFHPKIILQIGREKSRLIVGSANLTASGIAGNREVVGLVECTRRPSRERDLVAQAWQFLSSYVDVTSSAVKHQVEWMRRRAPWLTETAAATDSDVADGTRCQFLFAPDAAGIGRKFADLVGRDRVERLVVISPYWDGDLGYTKRLCELLKPKETVLGIDSAARLFPVKALRRVPDARLAELHLDGRFVHAKVLIAQTKKHDHVLYGSANCTTAALGSSSAGGGNAEACLYRRLGPDVAVKALDLSATLRKKLKPEAVPPFEPAEPIPLEASRARSPGAFELQGKDMMVWKWSSPSKPQHSAIELFDEDDVRIASVTLKTLAEDTQAIHFRISGLSTTPVIARLRYPDGSMSAPGVVTSLSAIVDAVRDQRSVGARDVEAQLEQETEEGLWLLDLIDSLEARDPSVSMTPVRSGSKGGRRGDTKEVAYATLPYSTFVKGRPIARRHGSPSSGGLVESEASLIRRHLNRLLGLDLGVTAAPSLLLDGSDDQPLGEVEGDLDEGDDGVSEAHAGGKPKPSSTPADKVKERAAKVLATRAQVVDSVFAYNDGLREMMRDKRARLREIDMLRLRTCLTIIVAAGQPIEGAKLRFPASSLQVLWADADDQGWPRLIGQTLAVQFGGERPAFSALEVDATHAEMPLDLVEAMVTCMWVAQAALQACASSPGSERLASHILGVAVRLYAMVGLKPEDLDGEEGRAIFSRLSDRFAGRLGLSPEYLDQAHQRAMRPALATGVVAARK